MQELKDIIVIYHDHCQDGFGAAFAAYKKFGETASYLPCQDRNIPPEGLIDKEVYIVDFNYPREVLITLEKANKKLVVIDHHISSQEDVKVLKEYVFSLEHSGAYLAWEYFISKDVPYFIQMLEIIDLAKDTEHTKEDIITYILSKPYTFEAYEQLLNEFNSNDSLTKITELGKAQHDYLEILINSFINKPNFVVFEGYTIPCINLSLPINEKSITLQRLYTLYPPFAMSYRFDGKQLKVSLRGNGEVDLTVLAGKYGGGGHRNSSGFVIPVDFPLPFAKFVDVENN